MTIITISQLIETPDSALKLAAAAVCALVGLSLLLMDYRGRQPVRTATRSVTRATQASSAPVIAMAPEPARLSPSEQYARLRATIALASTRTAHVNACQQSASIQLDSAEIALRRLIDDISGVMSVTIATAIVPRRSFAAQVPHTSTIPALAA